MINALSPMALPELKMPNARRSFVEPILRHNAIQAFFDPRFGNMPTATPQNGRYSITPSDQPAWDIQPTATPENGQYSIDPLTSSQEAAAQGSGTLAYGNTVTGPAGQQVPAGLAQFEASWGPARPNDAGSEVMTAVRRAAAEAFGPDATVVGTSGTGEHGSPRHRLSAARRIDPERSAGFAMDFKIRLPNGQYVEIDSPEGRQFAIAAARHGVSGMGAGHEYMGGHSWHMDTYPLENYSGGMGRAWKSVGDSLEQDFVAAYRPFQM